MGGRPCRVLLFVGGEGSDRLARPGKVSERPRGPQRYAPTRLKVLDSVMIIGAVRADRSIVRLGTCSALTPRKGLFYNVAAFMEALNSKQLGRKLGVREI